jgi:regulator of protease activity HflC (stomatin/prohibitin superfamily)
MISRTITLIFRGIRGRIGPALFFVLLLGSLALGTVLFLYRLVIARTLSFDLITTLMCVVPVLIFVVTQVMAVQAARMLRCWYNAQKDVAYEIVMQHLFGTDPPLLFASQGKLSLWEQPMSDPYRLETEARMNAGIPANLSVDADTAVFTLIFGKPYPASVKTAGFHMLLPFEQIRAVHDLRNRIASKKPIQACTKDGISVNLSLTAGFHIRREDEGDKADDFDPLDEGNPSLRYRQGRPPLPTQLLNALLRRRAYTEGLPDDLFGFTNPFPIDTQALHQVVYNRSVFQSKESSLENTVTNLISGFVRSVVARYTFGQIFDHSMTDEEPVSLGEIGREIVKEAKAAVASQGLTLAFAAVQLVEETPTEVFEQMQKHWQRQREMQLETFMNEADAKNIAARIDIILQRLKDLGYEERSLPELRRMVDEVYQLKRTIDWLTGQDEYDRYLYGPSMSGQTEPGDPDNAMSPGRVAHRREAIDKTRREAFGTPKGPDDAELDWMTANDPRFSKFVRRSDNPE